MRTYRRREVRNAYNPPEWADAYEAESHPAHDRPRQRGDRQRLSKLVFTILSAVAEAERDRIRERIATVKQDQRARGR